MIRSFCKSLAVLAGIVFFTGVSAAQTVLFTPGAPAPLKKAEAAVVHLRAGETQTGRTTAGESGYTFSEATLTATAISNDGDVLTALHGFHECLIEKGAATALPVDGSQDFVYTIDTEKAARVKCVIFQPARYGLVSVEAQVVATGPGWIPANFKYGDHFKTAGELLNDGYGDAGDFIILRLPQKPRVCVKASGTFFNGPGQVWSMGYPSETNRRNGHDSDGETLYYSGGDLAPKAQDVACMAPVFKNPSYRAYMDWYFNQPSMRWTSLDANRGSSGSPVFDKTGALRAMVIKIVNNGVDPRLRFCPATGVISVSLIKSITGALYGEKTAKNAFDCR